MTDATFDELLRSALPIEKPGAYRLECDEPAPAADDGPLEARLRCVSLSPEGAVLQMLEQSVRFVAPEHRAHPSLEAHLRAGFVTARALLDALPEDSCALPRELFFPEALGLLPDGDEAAFVALLADEALRKRLLAERDASEARARIAAIVGPEHADAVYGLFRTGYELETDLWCDEEAGPPPGPPEPGSSRLGGVPDLPEGFAWPRAGDALMTFVAQLDLAALPALPPGPDADLLPRSGVLSLFLDLAGGGAGDRTMRGPGRFFYFADRASLRPARLANPGDYYVPLPAFTARARVRNPELPTVESPFYALALETFYDPRPGPFTPYERTEDHVHELLGGGAMRSWVAHQPRHRVLGYPDELQGDLFAKVSTDESLATENFVHSYGSRAAAERAAEWRLVIQVDSDEDFSLGDEGRAYVFMRAEDLRARRFEKARVVWQTR